MTSCNDHNRKVRKQSKKPGKISDKTTERAEKQPGKPVEQVIYFMQYIHDKRVKKPKFQQKENNQEN